jgi:hypothetical protein
MQLVAEAAPLRRLYMRCLFEEWGRGFDGDVRLEQPRGEGYGKEWIQILGANMA